METIEPTGLASSSSSSQPEHCPSGSAADSVAGPAERMPAKEAEIAPLLIETANDISKRLGYLK
ncbi:hypothetical protein [Streptomyces cucumeris]|uniref:hypothetical protein n=1 Tax=Streptomyces cucumeris TaxID=2962890 RepID=UPI003D75F238